MVVKYRVQKRKMSPDVIEKNIGTKDNPKWKAYIAPLGDRKDDIAHQMCNYLNTL